MTLQSGKYAIFSKLDWASVGRSMIEPQDTTPKGIFKQPKDMGPNDTIVSNSDISHIVEVRPLISS